MVCNPISNYPDKIDEMTFFQDNNIENIQIINHYNSLITQGKYSEASDYINQQDGIYGYFADLFNLIENRIYKLQKYLLQKPSKSQPFTYYDGKAYPPLDITLFSDCDEVETLNSIKLFHSDNESDGEGLDSLHVFVNDEELDKEELEPPNIDENTIWI